MNLHRRWSTNNNFVGNTGRLIGLSCYHCLLLLVLLALIVFVFVAGCTTIAKALSFSLVVVNVVWFVNDSAEVNMIIGGCSFKHKGGIKGRK